MFVSYSKSGYEKVVELLLKSGADPNILDDEDFAPLHKASSFGIRNWCIDLSIKIYENIEFFTGHLEITKILLSYGANVNITGNSGVSPLYSAASESDEEIMKLLISSGADVNAQTLGGWTALHQASFNSNFYWNVLASAVFLSSVFNQLELILNIKNSMATTFTDKNLCVGQSSSIFW